MRAQLAVTLVMSILRGALRMQQLNKDDNLIQSPFGMDKDSAEWDDLVAGHELDWLAVEASETPKEDISLKQISMGGTSKEIRQKSYIWHITGQHEDATTGKDEASENLLFRNRIRLSHLTGHYPNNEMGPEDSQSWEGERVKDRLKAKGLGAAISHAAETLFPDSTIKEPIYLKAKVMVKNIMSPILAPEEVDPSQLEEAALAQSLETISIKMMPPNGLDHVN